MSLTTKLRPLILAAGLVTLAGVGIYLLSKQTATSQKTAVPTFEEAVADSAKRQSYLEALFGKLGKYVPDQTRTSISYEPTSYSAFLRARDASEDTYGLPQLWRIGGIPPHDDLFPMTTLVDRDLTPENIGGKNTIYIFKTAFAGAESLETRVKSHEDIQWQELSVSGNLLYESVRADHLAEGIPELDSKKFILPNGKMNMALFDKVSAMMAKTKECLFYEMLDNDKNMETIRNHARTANAAYLFMLQRWNRDLDNKDLVQDIDPGFIREIREVLSR